VGKIVATAGIQSLSPEVRCQVYLGVIEFDTFTPDNDPHGEHDFGTVEVDGHRCFWKIDYYDTSYTYGSEDPADENKTRRVLTIMLAEEY
jgi:hypothetical protein